MFDGWVLCEKRVPTFGQGAKVPKASHRVLPCMCSKTHRDDTKTGSCSLRRRSGKGTWQPAHSSEKVFGETKVQRILTHVSLNSILVKVHSLKRMEFVLCYKKSMSWECQSGFESFQSANEAALQHKQCATTIVQVWRYMLNFVKERWISFKMKPMIKIKRAQDISIY